MGPAVIAAERLAPDRRLPPPPPLPDLDVAEVDAAALGLSGPRLSFLAAGPGEGPPVVLLHGIAANATGWRFLLDALAASRFRAIAWNAPGAMLSDPFRAETPRPEDYADALAPLMDALGIGRADLVGSSFGTLVAMCFAVRHARRVRRLVLLGCSRGQRWKTAEERARMLAMRAAMAAQGGPAMARERAAALLGPDPDPAVLPLLRRMLAATDGAALLQAARCSDGADTLDYAPAIAAPALLLCGEEDRVNPPEVSCAVAAALPGARLVLLPGIGHLPELECPRTTAALVGEHLER
ncbi:MAG: alpha/beta fold hydrolase [Acetobacteraceae bacterium]|nr:alpha/beta fold hydrolase [Acetobacteraceae bacterium]MDW8397448.1 alpha/beta fold hydrolase [Acetobacteraceae bacterium]